VRFQLVESFETDALGIRRLVETRGLSRRIGIVYDKLPAAVWLAAHYLAQPLRPRWWAERPCAMQYGQSFAGFANRWCRCNAEREPQKALEIENALAEAHAALARFKMQCAWDWAGAEREFRQAIDLAPGSSEVHRQYAHYLVAMGRIAEAWSEGTRALELDPYGIRANSHQSWHHFYAREYDLAVDELLG
jgi:tetratricopeptide (TPR) repeat protein